MAKAEKGDLIRITNVPEDWAYKSGGIYEVTSVSPAGTDGHEKDAVNFIAPDMDEDASCYYAYDDQYVIHRKAGEEDAPPTATYVTEGTDVLVGEPVNAEPTQADRIRTACTELSDLLVRKNHDYGDSFAQQYEKYGLMSALIRMDDKMRRLETLQGAEGMAQISESIADTLLDLAGYALLAYVARKKGVEG